MNREKSNLSKVRGAIKTVVLWKKMMFLIPAIIVVVFLLFAVIYVEIIAESWGCIYEKCDTSVQEEVSYKQTTTEKENLYAVSYSSKKVRGTALLTSSLPHQKSTNQAVTDAEFLELAIKMKNTRGNLAYGLEEEAEQYDILTEGGEKLSNVSINTSDMNHWEMALEASKHTGWHPLFLISQWQLESAHFTSKNFLQNNNIAGQTWYEGSKYPKGTARPSAEGGWYIKYPNPVEGYVEFVLTNPRYSKVKTYKTPEEQAKAVAKAGWAADPLYANKLISMIEKNRKKYGDATVQQPGVGSTSDGSTATGEDLEQNDGDKVVKEAYKLYETRGINSSNKMKYSMDMRGLDEYGDCSEFTAMVYKKALGIDIGSTTIAQIDKNSKHFNTDKSQLKPGDLVYFNSPGGHGHSKTINGKGVTVDHTGIYVGDNKFIDMSSGKDGISVKDIGPGGESKSYFEKSFIGFIRVGSAGTGDTGLISGGNEYDEAEVHIRALANTDWYALDGVQLFEEDKNGDVIYKKGTPTLIEELHATMVEKTFIVAMVLRDDPDRNIYDYVSEKRYKDWDERDWMLNARFIVYNCYLIGNEKEETEGLFEWMSSLFDDPPCTLLDKMLNDGVVEYGSKKMKEAAKDGKLEYVVKDDDYGVLEHTYEKIEYSYTCHPPPPPPPEEEEKEEVKDKDSSSGTQNTPRVSGPQAAKGQKGEATFANHNSIKVGKDQHDCQYGQDEHKETTLYPVYPSLYAGESSKSILKNFSKYSLVIPGVTTREEETYETELEYLLREFYGDNLDNNESLLTTIGGGTDFIVPMEDGTYNYSSAFRSSHRPTHNGVDMGTLDVSGVPIYSTSNGTVVSTGWVNGYGYTVMIQHDNGYYSFYAHMLEDYIVVKKGQVVRQAQLVGGVDGVPDLAKHLHFEVCERSVQSASGNLMCADHVNPEADEVNLTLNTEQDKAKSNVAATKFLREWKEPAKTGKILIMPGFSSVTGSLSEGFENKDGGCVNNSGDAGGMSCGYYQFANNPGKVCGFVNWLGAKSYSDYYNHFKSYCPNGVSKVSQESAFMNQWHTLKQGGSYPADFKTAQYIYIKAQHYDPVANAINKNFGLNVNNRHVAVQEMIWSIGVQQPGHAPDMFKTAGYSKSTDWSKVTDKDIIEKVYQARHDKVQSYFSSSPSLWNSLKSRFNREKEQALALLGNA